MVVRADPVRGEVLELVVTDPAVCARYGDHTVRCWEIDLRARPPPVLDAVEPTVEIDGVDTLLPAGDCNCGLRRGDVWCWGACARCPCEMRPSQLTTTGDIVQVVAAGYRVCALDRRGGVTCISYSTLHDSLPGAVAQVESPVPFTWLRAVGRSAFCGATAENELYCWGATSYFMGLRSGCTLLDSRAPYGWGSATPWEHLWTAFPAGIAALDVAASEDAACIIDLDGNLQCMSRSGVLDPTCPLGLAPPFPERSAAPACAAEP
jgi:hypothetical protein